jgi:CheY-like chemotaxis protein
MNILLVEDEAPKQEHISSAILEVLPTVEIRIARSVRSAIDEMRQRTPDLMLLDMSLPTFDVGPTESGGRPQNFGGSEILRYMDLYDLHVPTIVITAYEAFTKAGKSIDHKSLHDELLEKHPLSYKGLIYYNSLFSEWRALLSSVISKMHDGSGK